MKITRLDNSSTKARYQVTFETPDEASMTNDDLYSAVEGFNYGGYIVKRDAEQAMFYVYID